MTRIYKTHQNRIRLVSISFLLINLLILSKTFFIQSFKSEELKDNTYKAGFVERSLKGERGNIYDRNGEILAETVHKYTFWVNTQKKFDKEKIVELFSNELDQPAEKIENLLRQKKTYIRLADDLLRTQCLPILSKIKEIKGLHYDIATNRYYPFENLASQIIGYVDKDGKGQFGIENQFNSQLNGQISKIIYTRAANGRISKSIAGFQPEIKNGRTIQLTIDVEIQAILVDALKRGLTKSHAISANGIIINPFNGEILAMASVPDFDPNNYNLYDISTFANRAISEAYEPGSTFKLIAMTAILESNLFSIEDLIYCEKGQFQFIPSKYIHDHEPHENLTLAEIFIHSSNIGITKMVDKLGSENIYEFARKFGFGIKTGVSLPGESSGKLRNYTTWSRLSGPSVSMGQEISINTLQLALAYSAAANGGYLLSPRIIKNISGDDFGGHIFSPRPIRQVMSKETSKLLLEIMEAVVNDGTATNAIIPGFRIGGKTGTAEKFINGSYSKRDFISSFACVFPINNPKYVCLISVDSPAYGLHWGNETATPIVKDIVQRLIINKNISPDNLDYIQQYTNSHSTRDDNNMLFSSKYTFKETNKVPNFIGKTLKQSIQVAKTTGMQIQPFGSSGKVIWQSIIPGEEICNNLVCQLKLESM